MNELIMAAVEIGGSGFVNQVLTLLVFGLCVGVVYAMGLYFARLLKAPPVAHTIWDGLFVLLGGVIVVNFLLGLLDKQFIKW